MAKIKGASMVLKIGANDISAYVSDSEFAPTADTDDTTGYGATGHEYLGTLTDGTLTISGKYDSTAVTGPRAAVLANLGTTVSVTRQTEGAGTGKPQDVFDAVVTGYTETAPVAGATAWAASFQISGAIDSTAQS